MTECDDVVIRRDEATREALVDVAGAVVEYGLEQPGLGARQGERDRLEHLERLLGQSGGASEDGVRTVGGTPASPAASTWATKNGFPPVRAYRSVGSTSYPTAS